MIKDNLKTLSKIHYYNSYDLVIYNTKIIYKILVINLNSKYHLNLLFLNLIYDINIFEIKFIIASK